MRLLALLAALLALAVVLRAEVPVAVVGLAVLIAAAMYRSRPA